MSQVSPYWRDTRRLTGWLLLLWVILTFGVSWFARELNEISFFGFPFGFYFAAQGILLDEYFHIVLLPNPTIHLERIGCAAKYAARIFPV